MELSLSLSLTGRLLSGGFNPASLFGVSDTGWVYDLSDMSTLFQDAAGTTPVTAVGQPVGLKLDKSKGLVLGPELVTNGTFDSDTNWSKEAGWSISNGTAVASSSNGTLYQSLAVTAGRLYRVEFTVLTRTSGSVSGRVGNVAGPNVSAPGTYVQYIVAGSFNINGLTALSSFSGTVDNISIKELPGNHRRQSTALNRPTYARHPLGGIRNLLTYTEQFDNAAWVKLLIGSALAPVVTANAGDAPIGGATADRVQFSLNGATGSGDLSVIRQSVSVLASQYVFSFWAKSFDSNSYVMTISAGTVESFITVTPTWQRFSVAATHGAPGSVAPAVYLRGARTTTNSNTADILIWGAQYEIAASATAYQRVGSTFDVTEAGVEDLYYLSYDGINDSLATASFAWGTDKATVVAGVRKLSDAGYPLVVEHSASANSNNGAFNIIASGASVASAGWSYVSRGTASAHAQVGSGYASPITNVITGLGDISADTSLLRVNGAQVATSATDQGTGNYGTYPVYFGARAGTSLFFNGREYSNVGINRLLTTDELAALESWTAGKNGVTLP